ncbi:Retroviral envelope protein containing protein [Cricetulus griseus]|uniref:Retroviral envelope protein containing protein n=1 Tax=Cricetulus griseus TaxID=10029 RepID=A0A061I1N9_CRIGR|nr:Retroviral envelope protein containing protein [Cricetulus griseus]
MDFPKIRCVHYMDDILLAAKDNKTLNKSYVKLDRQDPVWTAKRLMRRCNKQDEVSNIDPADESDVSAADPSHQCWNGSANTAVVMRVRTFVPILVKVDTGTFPIMEIIRTKWDFVITAALVTAITLSAAAATTAAVAMAAQVQTSETINDIVEKMATTLTTLKSIDGHLKSGILIVNQRVDLLQEQVDDFVTLTSIGCVHFLSSLCITSRLANNFTENSNLSWQLSAYLQGNWSQQFEKLTDTLTQQIVAVNATRLSLPTVNALLTTFKQAFGYLKEWAGVGVLLSMMLLAIVVCLCCLCRIRKSQKSQAAMLVQTFAAVEAGQSPQAWLSMLTDK